jgi:hypothetical protein
MIRKAIIGFALATTFWAAAPAAAERVELAVPVVRQQTNVWCWAATATMALQLHGYPNVNPAGNYQCGIVAVAFPECDADCHACIRPIGPLPNMVWAIERYQAYVARTLDFSLPHVRPRYDDSPTFEKIRQSLRQDMPVIAGISPTRVPNNPSETEHAVLISGVDDAWRTPSGERVRVVIVNDPFVYGPGQNPYERVGGWVDPYSGKAVVEWNTFRNRLNFSSAVFLTS